MGQLEGGGYPLQREFPLGGPIRNLAGTPMGQLGGGEMVYPEGGCQSDALRQPKLLRN